MMTWKLTVARGDLEAALSALRPITGLPAEATATLAFQDGHLVLRAPGAESAAAAVGTWTGEATVALRFLQSLDTAGLPTGDPVPVSASGGKLRMGTAAAPCVVSEQVGRGIVLPVEPPLVSVLRAGLHHTREELEAAGLAQWVRQANAKRDQLVADAAAPLAVLGVRPEQVAALVASAINDEAAQLPAAALAPFLP